MQIFEWNYVIHEKVPPIIQHGSHCLDIKAALQIPRRFAFNTCNKSTLFCDCWLVFMQKLKCDAASGEKQDGTFQSTRPWFEYYNLIANYTWKYLFITYKKLIQTNKLLICYFQKCNNKFLWNISRLWYFFAWQSGYPVIFQVFFVKISSRFLFILF